MRVLVLGGGAREHALVRRLAADPDPPAVVCAPGNPGIGQIARIAPARLDEPEGLVALARQEQVDLTVVGPELPLSLGVADRFLAAGLPICGPTAHAARLETSKGFAKTFMARHQIPTARFHISASLDDALRVVRSNEFGVPVVLKADGLAAGKGVVVAMDRPSAEQALIASMRDRSFGAAGDTVVVEEFLTGPEVSFFVLCDGERAVPIGSAQDHKRIFDDDRGPNTGGMGAFAPSPLCDAALSARVMHEVVDPVMAGMASEGSPFRGFLYVGLMLTASGPKVIEFNVRLGDPEAQVILPLLDQPIAELLIAAARGRLEPAACRFASDRVVGVVAASRGYPDSAESGQPITGIDEAERIPGVSVYHAGTALRDGRLVTAGGRVLSVVGRDRDFSGAIARAYDAVTLIHFDGMQYRRDIGRKALQPQSPVHPVSRSPQ